MNGGIKYSRWEIKEKLEGNDGDLKPDKAIDVLLRNRSITSKKQKNDFLKPPYPTSLKLTDLGLKTSEIAKIITRLKKAKKNQEQIYIYGDYDADGICATAILWECLYSLGFDALPYIPERFSEGYGIKAESVEKLKAKSAKLKIMITVDNGIVANNEIEKINKLKVDVIVTDHHERGRILPKALATLHTNRISGASIAWILAREIVKKLKVESIKLRVLDTLDLAAIGTVADQMPLVGANRSFAKYGIEALRSTKRVGLLAMCKEAKIEAVSLGTYEINYILAPRINAMGRIEHGIDSLRILCTNNKNKADELAYKLGKTNQQRQKIVGDVLLHARNSFKITKSRKMIILAHESYHEGVIGLAAGKLADEFHLPSIVIAKGDKLSKASARSIVGFNIIEAIRKFDYLLEGGGGHPMAAGFSILTRNLDEFVKKISAFSSDLLTDEVLLKKLKVDMIIPFDWVKIDFYQKIKAFEPFGIANPVCTFLTKGVSVLEAKTVGRENAHLKLKLMSNNIIIGAVGFGMGEAFPKLTPGLKAGIVYTIEENLWNGRADLELHLKDISFGG